MKKTLALVQGLFSGREAHCFSVDEVVSAAGLSKTTARRYLEHGVETGFLEVEMLYGKLAIRGGCIAALRSKLKPLAGREGLETSEAALLFDQLGPSGSPAFCLAISIISGGRPFATSLSG